MLGEVELKSRLDGSTYVLSFSPNRMASIEMALNQNFGEITQNLAQMSIRTLRTIIRLTYVQPKGAKPLTDERAGEIFDAVGYKPVVDALNTGLDWMRFGTEDQEEESAENPPPASGGDANGSQQE